MGAPDWILEIVSPSSLVLDTRTKFDLYAESGVAEYWIVFPGEQTVLAYTIGADEQYKLTGTYAEPGPMRSTTLPELLVDWTDLFQAPAAALCCARSHARRAGGASTSTSGP